MTGTDVMEVQEEAGLPVASYGKEEENTGFISPAVDGMACLIHLS